MKAFFAASLVSVCFFAVPAPAEVIFDLQDAANSRLRMEVSGTVLPLPLDPPWQFTFDESTDRLQITLHNRQPNATFAPEVVTLLGTSEFALRTDLDIEFVTPSGGGGNGGTATIGTLQDQIFADGYDFRVFWTGDNWRYSTTLTLTLTPLDPTPNSIVIAGLTITGSAVPEPSLIVLTLSGLIVGVARNWSQRRRRHKRRAWLLDAIE